MKLKAYVIDKMNIFKDFGLSFFSSVLVAFVTTIIINPLLADIFDASVYGTILTVCGYVAIVSAAVGNSLNNVRLLASRGNLERKLFNYNLLLYCASIVGVIIIFVLCNFYIHCEPIITLLVCIYCFIATINLYFIVSYRIKINYFFNFLYNAFVCTGYLIGIIVCKYSKNWPFVYIIGQSFGLIFILFTSSLPREGIRRDNQLAMVFRNFITLASTTFVAQALSLLDRLLLYPLIGDTAVSIYSIASFFGKGVGTIYAPIAMVLLSYFAKESFVISRKRFNTLFLLGITISIICFFISIPLAPIITHFLYPSYYKSVQPYIVIANISYLISAISILVNPFLLRVCEYKWQVIIQAIHGASYIILGMLGAKLFGLWGFSVAGIISNTIKLVFMYLLGLKSSI